MKFATIREFRDHATTLMKGQEPVFVTRKGKPAGIFLPLHQDTIPVELRKELLTAFGRLISDAMQAKGVTEEEVLEDFEAFRKSRRRR